MSYEERILPNDYPVFGGYIYLVNGKPEISILTGTIFDLKADLIANEGYANDIEIKSCDIVGRGLI